MTDEQLAELKAAWPGEWRSDGADAVLTLTDGHTVVAFLGTQSVPTVGGERGFREPIRSRRYAKTFTEAVASFRAEAEKVAKVYAALAGKTLV